MHKPFEEPLHLINRSFPVAAESTMRNPSPTNLNKPLKPKRVG